MWKEILWLNKVTDTTDEVIDKIDEKVSNWKDLITYNDKYDKKEWLVVEIIKQTGEINWKVEEVMWIYWCTESEATDIIVSYAMKTTEENEKLKTEIERQDRIINNNLALINKLKKELLLLNVPESDFPDIDLESASDEDQTSYIKKMKNFYEKKKEEKNREKMIKEYNKKVKILKNKFSDIKEIGEKTDLESETLILIKKLIKFIKIESKNISNEKNTSLKKKKLDTLLKNIDAYFFEIEKKIEEHDNLSIYERLKKQFF